MDTRLENRVRQHRKAEGFSQRELAKLLGVSRQAIHAIESGSQVPSTSLGLRLARVFGCTVEDLFRLVADPGMRARLAPSPPGLAAGSRVALGRVDGRLVAHRLAPHGMTAADGIVGEVEGDEAAVQPLADIGHIDRNVLVAGCAPVLGALAHRVGQRFNDARLNWLRAGNGRALDLFAQGMVHVAGLHLSGENGDAGAAAAGQRAMPGRRLLVANLTRWRQGLVVAADNPLGIGSGADLLRPGLRVAQREAGSGAHDLAVRLAEAHGDRELPSAGPRAIGHRDVARLVRTGSADVGITIEAAALAEGLDFVPLTEERFDLILPASLAGEAPCSRLLDALDDPDFRTELSYLPGYDGSQSGQVTTVEAA